MSHIFVNNQTCTLTVCYNVIDIVYLLSRASTKSGPNVGHFDVSTFINKLY